MGFNQVMGTQTRRPLSVIKVVVASFSTNSPFPFGLRLRGLNTCLAAPLEFRGTIANY